ncbi:transcriptional regulator, TetR family [Microbacterium sp. RURRCA19A]|nr:transcriptional regulator, TetR family [Microbacterium sp. RURRCA19A]
MSSEERREQILAAALAVFGAKGYVGATTDDVARAAGISQPYVVRLFGTKENLFVAALDDALDRLLGAFTAAAEGAVPGELPERVGHAYIGLLQVRGLHQTLSHAFLLGAHPVIGPRARDGFARVWEFLRDVGFDVQSAQAFLAQGMMINSMFGLRLADDYDTDPRVHELFDACFPADKVRVLSMAPRADEPW